MAATRSKRSSDKGAVLIHVAVGLIALMALSALVVDYGVMWVSRRQAQNAADAGALSAAVSLTFVDPNDTALAKDSGVAAAVRNAVWDGAPDVTTNDIQILSPANCPVDTLSQPPDWCVRADVFRNQRAGGNPLPTFFGQLVGLTQQGVRATATARMLIGDRADCLKPWAIPDKWEENQTPLWDPTDSFDRYVQNGNNRGALLNPADVYTPPSTSGPGSGFSLPADYGLQLTLKEGTPQQSLAPGLFFPVVINPNNAPGAAEYRNSIENCDPTVIGPGTVLTPEPGNMIGPTKQGVQTLIAQDPTAYWDSTANGGKGAPAGGCLAAGTCSRSPRLVALSVFNPDTYDQPSNMQTGRNAVIQVTNILGFFIDRMQGNDVVGYFCYYPSVAYSGTPTITPTSAFLRTVILVR